MYYWIENVCHQKNLNFLVLQCFLQSNCVFLKCYKQKQFWAIFQWLRKLITSINKWNVSLKQFFIKSISVENFLPNFKWLSSCLNLVKDWNFINFLITHNHHSGAFEITVAKCYGRRPFISDINTTSISFDIVTNFRITFYL